MKFLQKSISLVIMLCATLSWSQVLNETQNLKANIKELQKLLETKEIELLQAQNFLTELTQSDPTNALIKPKTDKVISLNQEVTAIKASLFEKQQQYNQLTNQNQDTTSIRNANIISFNNNQSNNKYWYNDDIRNPISFTEFIIRTPRTNGKDILTKPSNLSSYHYIKPGSIVNILFNDTIYKKLNGTNLTVSAYLKRVDGSVVPIAVSGFFDVTINTNQVDFEKNIAAKNTSNSSNLIYNYQIQTIQRGPIQTEVNTSMANPQPKDKLIITIVNSSDGNVSFTTTFEYEDFGWETSASGGFSWVNTINQGDSNFKPAGSSGVSFHYKLNKGAKFWHNFFNPSFGPELLVLQDANQNTNIGLGLSVSTFLRTVKVGYGWYLVGENGKPYVSIGVNFIEGYKSIASILARGQE